MVKLNQKIQIHLKKIICMIIMKKKFIKRLFVKRIKIKDNNKKSNKSNNQTK